MASWLKAAEDLFEVVDRRAKLVASELSEEQPDLKPPASNGSEFQGRRTKTKKPQLRLSPNGSPKTNDIAMEQTPKTSDIATEQTPKTNDIAMEQTPKTSDIATGQTSIQASAADNLVPNLDKMNFSPENAGAVSSNDATQTTKEVQLDVKKDDTSSDNFLIEKQPTIDKHDHANKMEVTMITDGLEAALSPINGELTTENMPDGREVSSSDSMGSRDEAINRDIPVDTVQNVMSRDVDVSLKIDQEGHVLQSTEKPSNSDTQAKESVLKEEPHLDAKKQPETKTDPAPMRVQDQLDEAQGLLKTTASTGQSKEARLARVCAGLSSRLQEYKSESAQLEELLIGERERSNSYESYIKKLQQDLSASKIEVSRVESNMAEVLAAKNSEIEALVSSLDTLKKQSAVSEGQLTSLQANMESIMRNRELTETRMMQALREELAVAERRAEEERAAHNSTKMATMEREVELEQRAVEASTALARMQRVLDERTSKATELEQKLAVVEAECASLSQELQDMEARARRGQKRSTEEASQALQVQARQEEVERARQGQRDAESKVSLLEAEVQKLRVEMAGMKRDAEHYSRQEHIELEKRYRELTDLLYHKQTQLEAMASEKAAVEFQMEKEVKRLQEAQMETERSRVSRRASSTWEEDSDLKALEPLPLHHRHMAGASLQLQKAVKLLDSGAVRATRFLWRYPVARVILLFYMVFVHLFLMYLLHRLQKQADAFAAQEVAASMGLTNPNLP